MIKHIFQPRIIIKKIRFVPKLNYKTFFPTTYKNNVKQHSQPIIRENYIIVH